MAPVGEKPTDWTAFVLADDLRTVTVIGRQSRAPAWTLTTWSNTHREVFSVNVSAQCNWSPHRVLRVEGRGRLDWVYSVSLHWQQNQQSNEQQK